MGSKELLPLVFQMGGRIWLIWGFHTTVAVAVIGWLITKRSATFDCTLKLVSTIGYAIFFITVCWAFKKAYKDLSLIIKDLEEFISAEKPRISNEGYIKKELLEMNYCRSLIRPIVVCSLFFGFILFLIWCDQIWH